MDSLPQEILFSVAEYGQCPEGLSNEYITSTLKSIYEHINLKRECMLLLLLTRLGDVPSKLNEFIGMLRDDGLTVGNVSDVRIVDISIDGNRTCKIEASIPRSIQDKYRNVIPDLMSHLEFSVNVNYSSDDELIIILIMNHQRNLRAYDLKAMYDIMCMNKDQYIKNLMWVRTFHGATRSFPADLSITRMDDSDDCMKVLTNDTRYNMGSLISLARKKASVVSDPKYRRYPIDAIMSEDIMMIDGYTVRSGEVMITLWHRTQKGLDEIVDMFKNLGIEVTNRIRADNKSSWIRLATDMSQVQEVIDNILELIKLSIEFTDIM
jgi:hypothetical protein